MKSRPTLLLALGIAGLFLEPAKGENFEPPILLEELNTSMQEKSPSISCDGLELFFQSNRNDGIYHIWVATRPETGDAFGEPIPLIQDAATPDISSDGRTLYFSMNVAGEEGLDIDLFQATRADRISPFGPPQPLVEINTAFKEASPSISHDGRTLYYHSDRPGGLGETDIWFATRDDTSLPFGPSLNLADVNTVHQEFTPSIAHDSKKLYFGSTRPGGAGNVDLWVASREDPEDPFGAASNLTAVNSEGVEKACDISCDGLYLYFRSKTPDGVGRSEISLAVDSTSGNVNRGAGEPTEVLFVNDSSGGGSRVLRVGVGESLAVRMDAPPAGPVPARYALYGYRARSAEPTFAPQPYSLGTTAFPTPLDGGAPRSIVIANLFEGPRGSALGEPLYQLEPAPATILEFPGGAAVPGRFILQAFLEDLGSVTPFPISITNAVILDVE